MDVALDRAIRRAISAMEENFSEPLTVDDLARAALFSKFHFSRVFHRATGVSPGRFLSALRLQKAKSLLVSTTLNVADISLKVGYSSVGTFSSRFSRSVGMSPTAYRRGRGFIDQVSTSTAARRESGRGARVFGRITGDPARSPGVFVGLFPDRIPEGQPVRCAALGLPGNYDFTGVPPGTWYLLAQSAESSIGAVRDGESGPGQPDVASFGPLTVNHDDVLQIELTLAPAQAMDPPVLLALMDARKQALKRVAAQRAGDALAA
ncbi:helix-turn-helix domain-containing protein [Actinoplanes sp. G11-F43]|uniref:helix-turn-helix domain-containing protein n=1 Tax=Actinoplanes sp. G11-F43 TaxID=3424130 RepID=UPI003D337D1F